MKKLFYLFALCSMMMLTACDSSELTPYGDKTKLWFAGVDGKEWVGGFINQDGKMVIPAKYYVNYENLYKSTWAADLYYSCEFPVFSCGWAGAYDMDEKQLVLIDKDGKSVPMEDWECYPFMYNYAQVWTYNGDYWDGGFVDTDLKVVVPQDYWHLGDAADNGLAYFSTPSDPITYGYVDMKGKEVIEAQFDHVETFNHGIAVVAVAGKDGNPEYGVINAKGEFLIDFQKKALSNLGEGLIAFGNNTSGKCGIWDKKGNEVLAATYDMIYPFTEGLAQVKKNDKYGFINTKGEVVINPSYLAVIACYDGVIWALKNKDANWELLDKKGNQILKLKDKEEPFSSFRSGLALIGSMNNTTLRYIDKEGKTVYKWTIDVTSEMPQRRTATLTEDEQKQQILRSVIGTEYETLFRERLGLRKQKNK